MHIPHSISLQSSLSKVVQLSANRRLALLANTFNASSNRPTTIPSPIMAQQVNLQDTKGDDWNKLADTYKKIADNPTNRPCNALLEHANNLLPFKEATAILDNGCGPGVVMGKLIQNYGSELPADCKLMCADFSEGMVQQVRKTKDESPADSRWKQVETKVSNAMDLTGIESNSKSHVTAGFVYFMTPDPTKCLTESHRVLKDGGVLSLTSWENSEWLDIMTLITTVRPDKIMPSIPKAWSSLAVGGELEKAGFKDVKAAQVETSMRINSYDETADLFTKQMPHMVAMQQDMSDDEKAAYRKIIIDRMQELVPNVPGDLKGVALVAAGRK